MWINPWASSLGLALLVLGLGSVTSCSSGDTSAKVALGAAEDRLPNLTASEIVTFADHVVVAKVADEKALPVPQEDIERREGLILRDLSFNVLEIVWSDSNANQAAPSQFNWTAVGWFFKGSVDERTVGGYQGAPRFEVGHTYILALDWDQQDCSAAGEWSALGGSFNMPYEQGVIGVGEFEGQSVSKGELSEARPAQGVRAQMWGKGIADLKAALDPAKIDQSLAEQMAKFDTDC